MRGDVTAMQTSQCEGRRVRLTFGFVCHARCSCSVTFDSYSVHGHTACVTEHEKYALGATKPGGFAARSNAQQQHPTRRVDVGNAVGAQFLSTRPPWNCSCCNVTATSKENLFTHAEGKKHKSKARARLSALEAESNKKQKVIDDRPFQRDCAPLQAANGKGSTPDEGEPHREKMNNSTCNGRACTSNGTEDIRDGPKDPTEDLDWKKCAKRVLKDAKDSRMRTKKLLRKILKKGLGIVSTDETEIQKLTSRMLAILKKSSRFEVKESTVILAKR